ncbi:MAG TPA: CAP domain-containing protein [Chthoniobacteraceae bacterium]|jgi:hypothetical protein|nr:CAP domain-containing protein [Chthoniobacteraceae bacterium]
MSRLLSALRPGWLLLLALCVISLPARGAVVLTPQEQAIASMMVNASGQHRPFMVLDDTLVAVARARALDLGRRNYFDHVNPDGHGPNYMVRAAGYPLPAWWGTNPEDNFIESIAGGRSTASATWTDWMNSPPHRDHILANTSFDAGNTSYGVGYAVVPGSKFTYYWVVITCPPRPVQKLAITAPTAAARVTTDSVAVTGTTSTEGFATSVYYRVENSAGVGAFIPATGLRTWSGVATNLQPGVNTIRVRSLDVAGGIVADLTRAITYVVIKPLTVAIAGDGIISAGYLGTTDRELGKAYAISAVPKAGSLFAGWTGSVESKAATLTFTMSDGFTLTANFIPNPFLARAGGYSGLLSGHRDGLANVTVAATGVFSGGLRYGANVYALKGKFASDGTATVTIPRIGLTPLTVSLQLDLATANGVSVSVDDAGRLSTAAATPGYRAAAGKFAGAGAYTVTVPAFTTAGAPQGNGFGRMTVDTLGRARLTVGLVDGTTLLASGTFSGDGMLSFYTPLYANLGAFTGSLTLEPRPLSDLDGTVHWTKPLRPTVKIHPAAIDATGTLLGSFYTPPVAGVRVLHAAAAPNNGALALDGGNLPSPGNVDQTVTIDAANHVTLANPALPGLRVLVSPTTGIFLASFVHPMTGKVAWARGVIFQRQNAGLGYFLGADDSGTAALEAK